ncbi:hypothetical protein AB0L59_26260 [Streptomyces sp. NPDC052109]|uniref:hypothetical protein n=1 Tax=Streptomyces sp. NPDC052109 TaxID=3155527 RepID=UPI0034209005
MSVVKSCGSGKSEAGDVELGAQGVDAVVEPGVAGVADQGGDGGVDRGGAQVEVGEEPVGEVDFVVGLGGVEGGGEGAQGLVMCGIAGFGVLFGFRASGEVCGGRAFGFSLRPPQVAQDALVASFPSQGLGGGVCGGEVSGEPGCLGETASGAGAGRPLSSATCWYPRRDSWLWPMSW